MKKYRDGDGMAILYDIAGRSRINLAPLSEQVDSQAMLSGCTKQICRDILRAWSNVGVTEDPASPIDFLVEWLGDRIEVSGDQHLHLLVREAFESGDEITLGHKSLINPFWLLSKGDDKLAQPDVVIRGLVHGDLHPGNILVDRRNQNALNYFLIDFATAEEKPLGFDQAYLEAAVLLNHLKSRQPEQLIGILNSMDQPEQDWKLPPENVGAALAAKSMRLEIENWISEHHDRRKDSLHKQFCLARVAAGLNWAAKRKLDLGRRKLGLYYAAWETRCYLERFYPDIWSNFDRRIDVSVENSADAGDNLWSETWKLMRGLAPDAARYVLVSDTLRDDKSLQCLGLLPWSMVIDLDPVSDLTGLHHHCAETLKSLRNLIMISQTLQEELNFQQSTAWMMAGGWARHSQPSTSLVDWRRKMLPNIRRLLSQMYSAIAPDDIRVVVLHSSNGHEDEERLKRLIEAIDEAFAGSATIIQIGGREPLVSELATVKHIPMNVIDFAGRIHTIYGDQIESMAARIPKRDSSDSSTTMIELSLDDLHRIQEDMTVLHSSILTDPSQVEGGIDSAFWRGAAPTWGDLNARVDLTRDLEQDLLEEVVEELQHNRNYTILLRHRPGAGGTTLGLRIAWNLRQRYPVAVLRRWSRQGTANRLEMLFHTSGFPVLLVADSAILSNSEREELYRELSSRNCRVVLLYVLRVLGTSSDESSTKFFLPNQMSPTEADRFLKAYLEQTDDQKKRSELRRLTEDEKLVKIDPRFSMASLHLVANFR
jgi:hypothetical protein